MMGCGDYSVTIQLYLDKELSRAQTPRLPRRDSNPSGRITGYMDIGLS
jgi:hypothetical protein